MPDENVPYFNKTKIVVCTTPWTPAVFCDPDTDPVTWTGFEIEVFRTTTTRMGLAPGMLDWRCYMDKQKFFDDLYDSKCDIAPAGMAPFPDRMKKGLRFSVPSIQAGFSIMVTKDVRDPGMWYFFSAMTWEVWMLMIVTGIAVGIIVWLFEVGMRALNTDTHNMSNVMWDTLGRPVQMRDYRLASFPANLTAILWSFLVYILMLIYGANLTANLTISQFKNDIRGLKDLPGKAVASFVGHQEELKKYNIASMGMPWDDEEDEKAMIATLKSGLVRALVFDSSLLKIYDATDCDTMLVGDEFDLHNQCVAFPPNTWQNYPGFVDAFDVAMLSVVQGSGGVEGLVERFISVPPAACKNSDLASGYASVTVKEVAGLWVILSISILISALIVILYRLWESKIGPWAARKGYYNPEHSEKIKTSYATFKRSGFSSEMRNPYEDDDEDDDADNAVKHRYKGASKGYVDGSTDIFPNGVHKSKAGSFSKRRMKYGSKKLVVDNTLPAASDTHRNPNQENGPVEVGVNGRKSSLSSGEQSTKQVWFGSSDGTTPITTAASIPDVIDNRVLLPSDSARIEASRIYADRMATFKLSNADYDIDGDNQV